MDEEMASGTSPLRRTPLFEKHLALGARLVEFGGWEMPVQYSSILKEHAAVRSEAGIFDISHMGEIRVRGAGADAFLNEVLTNNLHKIKLGESQYSLLLTEKGGVVDDLFVYAVAPSEFLLVVNASHIEDDFELLSSLAKDRVEIVNESESTAAIALQGPRSPETLDAWISGASGQLSHHAIRKFSVSGVDVWVARTGYTGEDGFEILCPATAVCGIWDRLLAHGAVPCGLGARDTLRMEVCYPLNGHELGPEISPLEAGLSFFIDFGKPDFRGKAALLAQKTAGVPRKSVALVSKPGGPPPRAGYPILRDGKPIGVLTSGGLSPSLQTGMGLGLVSASEAVVGNSVDIEIRGKYVSASIVKKPIYRKNS